MVAENLEEGISDLFSKLEREGTMNHTLRTDIRVLLVKLAEMQESETEVVRLRSNLEGMSNLVSELERERRTLRRETERLEVKLAEAQAVAQISETEVVRLRGELGEGMSDLVSQLERETMTKRTSRKETTLFEVKSAEAHTGGQKSEAEVKRLRWKLKEGISDLVSQLEHAETTNCTLRKETKLLEVKLAEAHSEAQRSEMEVGQMRRKLEGMSDLVSQVGREKMTNSTLKKETRLLEVKLEEAQSEAQKSETEVGRLRRKLKEAMSVSVSQLEHEKTTNCALEKQTKLLEVKLEEAQSEAQKSEAEVGQLRWKFREAMSVSVSQLEHEKTTNCALRRQTNLLEAKLAEAQSETQRSEMEVGRLRWRLEGMSDLVSQLEREKTTNCALGKQTRLLEVKLEEAQSEAQKSEAEVGRLHWKLKETTSDLVSQLEHEKTTNCTLREETKLLEAKLAEAQTEAQKSETEVGWLRWKLEETMSDLVSQLEGEKTTNCALRDATRLLEVKLAEAQTEAQKSDTEVGWLHWKLREADANYKSAVSSAEEAWGYVQSQVAENKRFNQVIERHQRASKERDAEICQLRATVNQKEKEVKRLSQIEEAY